MAKNVHRLGDYNSYGAPIISVNQSSVYVDNLLISVDGSKVQDHIPNMSGFVHRNVTTTNGSSKLLIENKRVNCLNDPDSCGHVRIAGSPNLFIGGE